MLGSIVMTIEEGDGETFWLLSLEKNLFDIKDDY